MFIELIPQQSFNKLRGREIRKGALRVTELNPLDYGPQRGYDVCMVVTSEVGPGQLEELIKQVQAGNEVVLTQHDKPVARLVPAHEEKVGNGSLRVRSFKGHQVLTPNISQADLAEDMFGKQ